MIGDPMSKLVKQRGDTATNLDSQTPAVREMAIDITNNRLAIGDGLTAGGIKIPNHLDTLNNVFTGGDAGGTANALTITLAKAPSAYVKYMEVVFKAASNNTGATTLNINGLGVKNIYKLTSGSLGNLVADDLVSGATYKAIYDGTQFIIFGIEAVGLVSISQGDLNTATGTFSGSTSDNIVSSILRKGSTVITLPGGQYGFMIGSNQTTAGGSVEAGFWPAGAYNSGYQYKVVPFSLDTASVITSLGQQRYISSSPPFDMGDGDAQGFMFLVMNSDGSVAGHYFADVPPWGYNGKTDIRACAKCPITGDKMRRVMKKRSLEEIMDGAKIEYEYQKITMAMKNADMEDIPTPFDGLISGQTVVMIDPMDERLDGMIELQNDGGGDEITQAILSGKIYTEDKTMSRKGPKGVQITPLRFKYSGTKNKK